MAENIKRRNKKARIKALINYILNLKLENVDLGDPDRCIVHYGLVLADIEKSNDWFREVEEDCESFSKFYGIDAVEVEENIYYSYRNYPASYVELRERDNRKIAKEVLSKYLS